MTINVEPNDDVTPTDFPPTDEFTYTPTAPSQESIDVPSPNQQLDPIYIPPQFATTPTDDLTPPPTPQPTPTPPLTARHITPYGHVYSTTPNSFDPNSKTFIRIFIQNVNSLQVTSPSNTGGMTNFFQAVSTIQADIFMANETFLDTTKSTVRSITKRVSSNYWRTFRQQPYNIHSTSSIRPSRTFSKPGGNMIGLVDNLTGRLLSRISDPLGRWCGFILHGKDQRKILFLIAYQVPSNSSPGDTSLEAQQDAIYRLRNIRNPNSRKLFLDALEKLVTEHRLKAVDIFLAGDFNEKIGVTPYEMARVLHAGDLTDIYHHKHGMSEEPVTYIRGSRRVDYAFASPRLLKRVLRMGYLPFHDVYSSDHRGYFVDLDLSGLFDR